MQRHGIDRMEASQVRPSCTVADRQYDGDVRSRRTRTGCSAVCVFRLVLVNGEEQGLMDEQVILSPCREIGKPRYWGSRTRPSS